MTTTKRGPLSKAEIYYIVSNPDGLSPAELAKELQRSIPQVEGVVEKAKEETKKEVNKDLKTRISAKDTTTPVRPETITRTLMGRHKRRGKHVATVMTKAASELGDDRNITPRSKKDKHSDSIHKPYGND